MATRYWVGGSGTWDSSDTTHWSSSSGGSGGASVPTSSDNVVFDANSNTGTGSFTVTDGYGDITCNDFTASGLDGAMTFSINGNLNCYGSMSIPASNFSWSVQPSGGSIYFLATSTGKTLTTNNVSFSTINIHFDGVGGGWTLSGNLTCKIFGITTYAASFNFGNNNLTSSGGISIGPTVSGLGGTFTMTIPSVFRGGGNTFTNVVLSGGGAGIEDANTITSLTLSGFVNKINYLYVYANQTIGTLTISGAAANKYVVFKGDVARTLSIGTLSGANSNTGWKNITLSGAVSPKTFGFGVWNLGGNSNITFDTSTSYWVGGTNSWSSGNFAVSSGGGSTSALPGPQNNVVFDANSNTGTGAFAVTVDESYYAKAFTATAVDGAMSLVVSSGFTFDVAGDWTTPSSNFGCTLDPSAILCFSATSGTQNIRCNGVVFSTASANTIQFNYPSTSGSATYAIGSNFACTGKVTLYAGTLDLGGYTMSCDSFNVTEGTYSKALTWNGGTLTMSGYTYPFNTYNATSYFTTATGSGAGTMRFTAASATVSSIYPYTGFTYNATISLDGANSTYELASANCTAYNITNTAYPITVKFTPTGTHYFNSFSLNGVAGNMVTLSTLTGTSAYTLSKSSGSVGVSYCNISRSNATGGATWNAYTNNGNVDGGNNTGWVFISPYAGNFFFGSNF